MNYDYTRKEHIQDLEGEIWIKDSGYEISNKGRIITKHGKLFKGTIAKDGIKHHNWIENLEWCTKKENQEHEVKVLQQRNGEKNCKSKLKEEQVLEIYNLCKEGKMKYKDIAEIYNIDPCEVSLIVGGYKWKYLNLEPLPTLTRGSRSRGKKVLWINEEKEYPSIVKCYEDMKNTYGITICDGTIKKICNGELSEHKGQKFKWL